MPVFGANSTKHLNSLSANLQIILIEAIKTMDFSIISSYRGPEEQNRLFLEKKSKLTWPRSKHNVYPAKAVDIAPYYSISPHIFWKDEYGFIYLAGRIMQISVYKGFPLRWGGDWNRNNNLMDETFHDFGHFEDLS